MERDIIATLVEQGLSSYQLAEHFNCGQTTIRYWLRKFKLKTKFERLGEATVICSSCNRTYFYDPKNRQGHGRKICNSCHVNKRRFIKKQKTIAYKGGACQRCGYNKCSDALDFHHLDPKQKDFGIGGKHSLSWQLIKKELDKCEMICANCHREEHYNLRNNPAVV